MYFNDTQVYYLGQIDILDEDEAIATETAYTGYDEIEKHINDIPCLIYRNTNTRAKKQFLIIHKQDTCKDYTVYEGSEAVIKVRIDYRETNPRFKEMLDIRTDKVFQYMMQFLPKEREDINENTNENKAESTS